MNYSSASSFSASKPRFSSNKRFRAPDPPSVPQTPQVVPRPIPQATPRAQTLPQATQHVQATSRAPQQQMTVQATPQAPQTQQASQQKIPPAPPLPSMLDLKVPKVENGGLAVENKPAAAKPQDGSSEKKSHFNEMMQELLAKTTRLD